MSKFSRLAVGSLPALLLIVCTGCQTGPNLADVNARDYSGSEVSDFNASPRTALPSPTNPSGDWPPLLLPQVSATLDEDWTRTGIGIDPLASSTDTRDSAIIYFEYDQSTIGASEQPKLEKLAELLKSGRHNQVVIEGHCDEQGSTEYNRSLGEQRAIAVREYLSKLGVANVVLNTVSYGEERPADAAVHELNRRAEFVFSR